MRKPKVLYLIYSSTKESGGGHFYSLKTISTALKNDLEYRILNLGYTHGQVLQDLPNCDFIEIHRSNFIFEILKVYKYVSSFRPDVLHAFDFNSLFIARTVAIFFKVRVVFTKAGGRNTTGYIPDTDGSLFFSLENYNYYTSRSNKSSYNVLIPNRVNLVSTDEKLSDELIKEYNIDSRYVLLRISRFNPYYDQTFKQAISLLKKVLRVQPDAVLVLIGRIQSQDYFSKLKEEISAEQLPVTFVTDDKYTKESSLLLSVANVVIATGRGVMEACSLNKIVFCPVSFSEYPALLDSSTFPSLFSTNFSERGKLDADEESILPDDHLVFSKSYDPQTKFFFEEYFNVNNVTTKYLEFYKRDYYSKFRISNYVGHFVRFFK